MHTDLNSGLGVCIARVEGHGERRVAEVGGRDGHRIFRRFAASNLDVAAAAAVVVQVHPEHVDRGGHSCFLR